GALVGILYNTQLMNYEEEDGVAAYGIMMYVSMVFVGIFFGYANGVAPVTGYHYGAQNHKELQSLFKKSLVLTVSASVIMLLSSELLAVPLSLVFAGYDEHLYALTLGGFRIFALSFLFSGVAIYGSSFFTALNNGLVSAVLSFARTVVFQVACVLLFPLVWGIDGIWISLAVAEALAVVVTVVFFVVMRKKYKY
ncbi:MAG: MATE family efflux transporter, partial [Clostridia bacterium]|nr:MATE family efflux transporter [Clostridia bacterium]